MGSDTKNDARAAVCKRERTGLVDRILRLILDGLLGSFIVAFFQ
jgi:hypothetical protein